MKEALKYYHGCREQFCWFADTANGCFGETKTEF